MMRELSGFKPAFTCFKLPTSTNEAGARKISNDDIQSVVWYGMIVTVADDTGTRYSISCKRRLCEREVWKCFGYHWIAVVLLPQNCTPHCSHCTDSSACICWVRLPRCLLMLAYILLHLEPTACGLSRGTVHLLVWFADGIPSCPTKCQALQASQALHADGAASLSLCSSSP